MAGVELKFHARSVFPLLAGGVKPRRDVQFLQRTEHGGRTVRWGLGLGRMRNH